MSSESNPGVQVTRSSNNVYTLLLVVSLVFVVSAVVYLAMVNKDRFGFSMPVGAEYDKSLKEAKDFAGASQTRVKTMNDVMLDARNPDFGKVPSAKPTEAGAEGAPKDPAAGGQ
jgi:hypothetical protein